jgi:hypothetical protein
MLQKGVRNALYFRLSMLQLPISHTPFTRRDVMFCGEKIAPIESKARDESAKSDFVFLCCAGTAHAHCSRQLRAFWIQVLSS